MIMENNRMAVIENIKNNAAAGDFYAKVEIDDPVLTKEQAKSITDNFMKKRKKPSFKIKSGIAMLLVKATTKIVNRSTVVMGVEKIPITLQGAIVTSNHFGPLENTVVRYMVNKSGRRKLSIISQITNFAKSGLVGYVMNYANTIPISVEPRYLATDFLKVLNEKLVEKGEFVLLYPEQEMWFNYRKPRPPKEGAYFFAAKLNVPVVSCFVEIRDCNKDDSVEFKKVQYTIYVLDIIYPDKEKAPRENAVLMAQKDYNLKKECYERVYGKKLNYDFCPADIAGLKAEAL